jgi:predicted phage tail protein
MEADMMTFVKLYGHLGKKFGRIHRLDIQTAAEALRALKANFKDFGLYLQEHSAPGYKVITDMGARSVEQLGDPLGGKSIKIVPGIAGAGPGAGQFILGAVLFVVGEYVNFQSMGLGAGFGQGVANIGIAMMVGGAAQMLFAPPAHPGPNNSPANTPSYSFSGAVNTVAQGNPVPVCYGRMIVGSQVISGGLYSANIPT